LPGRVKVCRLAMPHPCHRLEGQWRARARHGSRAPRVPVGVRQNSTGSLTAIR
jgi:hypothetical protein